VHQKLFAAERHDQGNDMEKLAAGEQAEARPQPVNPPQGNGRIRISRPINRKISRGRSPPPGQQPPPMPQGLLADVTCGPM
jgi:hypothetical protein